MQKYVVEQRSKEEVAFSTRMPAPSHEFSGTGDEPYAKAGVREVLANNEIP